MGSAEILERLLRVRGSRSRSAFTAGGELEHPSTPALLDPDPAVGDPRGLDRIGREILQPHALPRGELDRDELVPARAFDDLVRANVIAERHRTGRLLD